MLNNNNNKEKKWYYASKPLCVFSHKRVSIFFSFFLFCGQKQNEERKLRILKNKNKKKWKILSDRPPRLAFPHNYLYHFTYGRKKSSAFNVTISFLYWKKKKQSDGG